MSADLIHAKASMTAPHPAHDILYLGIDTGGTYTDAVLWSETAGLVAKAKALTTRHDLSIGIAGAADAVLERSGTPASSIRLVSMSTTLATNALVEGQGGRVALVMIGFTPADIGRAGLSEALGTDPVIYCEGGHDVHGNAMPLDLSALEEALPTLRHGVSGVAVAAYFAVRNPAHELAACDLVRRGTGLPVTASHELSAKLGGPRRALTTLLNARLISMIDRLIHATTSYLDRKGIRAPLMVVRGDGALVSADFAKARPIETILSGPAASLVGARHLTGLDAAIVSDIGGTTTDVAVIDGGRPRLDPEGASVGGYRTMVEAVAMRTFGLGGDSEVWLDDGGLTPVLRLGPRRLVPLSLAATTHGESVVAELDRQSRTPNPGRMDGRFAVRTGVPERMSAGLSASEAKLFALVPDRPAPLDRIVSSTAQIATLDRLVARGLVHLCGFTPSDAAHVTGSQATWSGEAARLGAVLFARRRDGRGAAIAADGDAISQRVLSAITRRSAEVILETALVEDGLDGPALVAGPLIAGAFDGRQGIAGFRLGLDRPVIGLGASAGLHYADLPGLLGVDCRVPDAADVANALGAVVGQVRITVEGLITQPQEGIFRVAVGPTVRDIADEEAAIAWAEDELHALAMKRAAEAGAASVECRIERDIREATVEGRHMLVEARIVATASGRPRIAEAEMAAVPARA